MPNKNNTLIYEFRWETCRDKPLIQGVIAESLRESLLELATRNNLRVSHIRIREDGKVVQVRVGTDNRSLSPQSIAYYIKKRTSGMLRTRHPELLRLPALWKGRYDYATVGKGVIEDA